MAQDGFAFQDISSIYKAAVKMEEKNKKYFVADEYGDMTVIQGAPKSDNEQTVILGYSAYDVDVAPKKFICVQFRKVAGETNTSIQSIACEEEVAYWIGRNTDCNVVIDDASVSRRHAILRIRGSELFILDYGNMNGTFVNNNRIESMVEINIKPDDVIRVGQTEFMAQLVAMR